MGTSNWQNISFCCELIHQLRPRRVLDIGVGSMGRWGMLVREFVDVWGGNVLPGEWRVVLDGVEAFAPMLHPLHYEIYDHIYVGDAFGVVDRLDHYDLIILGDVIEHFPHDRALAMLAKCVRHGRYALVATPLGKLEDWPQDDMYGNRFEEHQTILTREDFGKSPHWRVVRHKLFRDYRFRPFGVFLLHAR